MGLLLLICKLNFNIERSLKYFCHQQKFMLKYATDSLLFFWKENEFNICIVVLFPYIPVIYHTPYVYPEFVFLPEKMQAEQWVYNSPSIGKVASYSHGQNIWDKLSILFFERFLLILTRILFWEENWALDYHSIKCWTVFDIF